MDIRSPDTPPLSALDCLFRADFSCKHGGWRASSSPAKLSSQMGGWPFPPLVFLFFFFPSKSASCLFLLFPVLIYNLPETVDSHSLTAKRIRRGGRIKEPPHTRRIRREELLVQTPLMSHTGLGSRGLGTGPRLDQRSQFK